MIQQTVLGPYNFKINSRVHSINIFAKYNHSQLFSGLTGRFYILPNFIENSRNPYTWVIIDSN